VSRPISACDVPGTPPGIATFAGALACCALKADRTTEGRGKQRPYEPKTGFNMTDDLQIHPRDVKGRLDRGDKFLLVDVRQDWEHQTCRIEGAKHVPLSAIPANLGVFEEAEDVVLYCHHGMRSLDAAAFLRQHGVNARSLAGGIERWSLEIDPKVPRY
jgi:adenylyltransferase/sulfurtransferase